MIFPGRRLRAAALAAYLSLLLSACALTPPVRELPGRDAVRDFALSARFALRQQAEAGQQSGSGRLDWWHRGGRERILIADPLGRGLAELELAPEGAELRLPDQRVLRGSDAASLLAEAVGIVLPVGDLAAWLLGRGGLGAQIERDALARPLLLRQGEWRIAYVYDDDSATALPARLTLRRGGDLELRLRIEEWRQP